MPSRPVSVRYRAIVALAYVALLGLTGCSAAPKPTRPGESAVRHSWYGHARNDQGYPLDPGRPGVGTEVEPK